MSKKCREASKSNQRLQANQRKSLKHGEVLENFNILKEMIKFDGTTSEVQAADLDWLIIRGDLLREIFEGLRAYLGRGANIAIKAPGKTSGKRFFASLLNRNMELKEIVIVLNLLINEGGWGKSEITVDYEGKKATVTLQNCITARKTRSTEPSCTFLTGYFEGFFEKLFNKETQCIETACIAKGDAVCEFQITPKNMA
jgi:predicted hydrocarbon binding protein